MSPEDWHKIFPDVPIELFQHDEPVANSTTTKAAEFEVVKAMYSDAMARLFNKTPGQQL